MNHVMTVTGFHPKCGHNSEPPIAIPMIQSYIIQSQYNNFYTTTCNNSHYEHEILQILVRRSLGFHGTT